MLGENSMEFIKQDYLRLLAEGKLEAAEKYRLKTTPHVLCKYVALNEESDDDLKNKERNEKKFYSLENDMLWFSRISSFNDPYEYEGMYIDESAMTAKGVEKRTIESINSMWNEYAAVSLSERPVEYLPMWAYYTNDYRGYCIEYEVVKPDAIHRVFYETDKGNVTNLYFRLFAIRKDAIENGDKGISTEEEKILTVLRQIMWIKSQDWEHEKEFRLIYLIESGKNGINAPIKNYGLRVKRIVAGYNCSEQHIERLKKISEKLGIGKPWRSEKNEHSYGMSVRQLE